MYKKISVFLLAFLLAALPCFAEWHDAELEECAVITADEMKDRLTKNLSKIVYVREAEDDEVMVYVDTTKIPALAKKIAFALDADKMTYVYCNDKSTYKDLASRLRYYAGREYNFNGYRLVTEKEGEKVVDGTKVYRLWVMKVARPQEVVVYNPYPPVVVDVFGWPWHHHHHHGHFPHHGPPPHHRR